MEDLLSMIENQPKEWYEGQVKRIKEIWLRVKADVKGMKKSILERGEEGEYIKRINKIIEQMGSTGK